MKSLKYFNKSEFVCDGKNCFNKMDGETLVMLDDARGIAGTPFKINSSWRNELANDIAGGKPNSAHLRGTAVDIACNNSTKRNVILGALFEAGFTRIGIAKTFIHADTDEELPQNVVWLY